jgi:hypothetical protein
MSTAAPVTQAPAKLELVQEQPPSPAQLAASEMNRWMLWFGTPLVLAAAFVGGVFATGRDWLIGPAAALVVGDIFVLVWLALSSDTNGVVGEPPSH